MAESQPIYLITDGGGLRSQGRLVPAVRTALEAGEGRVRYLQLREQRAGGSAPGASDAELKELVEELAAICASFSAGLILNRRIDLENFPGASGAHLGAPAAGLRAARAALPEAVLGYSAHSVEEAAAAAASGADYILLSPIFPPYSKPDRRLPLGTGELRRAAERLAVPVFALGGLSPDTIPACRMAGAAGAAMLSAVLCAPDPGAAVRAALAAWDGR